MASGLLIAGHRGPPLAKDDLFPTQEAESSPWAGDCDTPGWNIPGCPSNHLEILLLTQRPTP